MKLRLLTAASLLAVPAFPRISPDEECVLRDFLQVYGRMYDHFSIDVPVGRGASCLTNESDIFDHMWAAVTRRRIDMLAFHATGVDVVEAKLHATMKAATQVRGYRDDYEREHPDIRRVRPLIVCRSASPGLAGLLLNLGGRVIEIPAIVAAGDGASFHSSQENRHG